jgi:hypothetical protein
MSRAEACGETLPRGTSGEFLNGAAVSWEKAWRRGGWLGTPRGEGEVRVEVGRVSDGARSRPGGTTTRDRGNAPGSGTVVDGPCLESMGQLGEKGNGPAQGEQYPSRFIQNISERLELIRSNGVLPEF